MRDKLPPDPECAPGYLEMLAERLDVDCINAGLPGSCNRRIIRSTLRDSINHDGSTLFMIQLTHLHRTQKASRRDGKNDWKFDREDYFESVKPFNESTEPHNAAYVKHHMMHFDEHASMTDLTADVLMLTGWLKSRDIPYYIFSYLPLVSDHVSNQLCKNTLDVEARLDPAVMSLLDSSLTYKIGFGDYYYDADGLRFEVGHFNTAGHQQATEILLHDLNRYVLPRL
jgi:hypothetical protein